MFPFPDSGVPLPAPTDSFLSRPPKPVSTTIVYPKGKMVYLTRDRIVQC